MKSYARQAPHTTYKKIGKYKNKNTKITVINDSMESQNKFMGLQFLLVVWEFNALVFLMLKK
jgi:hypothetical protein